MLQSVPQRGNGKPRLLVHLECLTPITVLVIGPNTLYLAETDVALMATDDSGLIDAVQVNQASGIVTFWAKGDVWAAGSLPFKALIYIPGMNSTGSLLPTAGDGSSDGI